MEDEKYIRFDWAAKRILRQKANYGVLEGLVTVLLGENIKIVDLLESESNQDDALAKFNRVDIKARNSKGEIIIVEIQLTRELEFLQRILFGVSKAITEHIFKGEDYRHVKKVYSINILYFDLGQGNDYLYHGQTVFTGVHTQDTLRLASEEAGALRVTTPSEIFPEYYLIRVNEFNQVATTPLEEWIDFLKNARIKDDTTTPGLEEARETLQYMKMTHDERVAYDQHIDAVRTQHSVFRAARLEGMEEGLSEGRMLGITQGREEGRIEGLAKGREEGLAKGREEGREEGLAKGREEGREEGLAKGREEGLAKGREEGREEGLAKGREKGREEGLTKGREEGLAKGREEGLAKGREEGLAKGRDEGREEGVRHEKEESARKMKVLGMASEVIAQVTGLTTEEIARL